MERSLLFKIAQIIKYVVHEISFQVKKRSYKLSGNSSRVFTKNGFIDYYDSDVRRHYCIINGKSVFHRDDGPAKEWISGKTEYHMYGEHIEALDNKHIYGKEKLAKYLTLV